MQYWWLSLAVIIAPHLVNGDTMKTSIALYGNSSCSQPASVMTFTSTFNCVPQADHFQPICEDNGIGYSVTDCTKYYSGGWDNYGLVNTAFGWSNSYLLVEEYDTTFGGCGSNDALDNATMYLLNEECHMNREGTASTKFTLGHSLTIAKYSDPDCSVVSSKTEVTYANASSGACINYPNNNYATRYYLQGPTPNLTAVAVFDDNACSEAPVKITFTQDFGCGAERDPAKAVCGPDGSTQYSVSSCAREYSSVVSSVFGNSTPYIIVEAFANYWCDPSYIQNATVYKADSSCHPNTDDASSFRVTLAEDGSAAISTYADLYCGVLANRTDVSKRTLTSNTCVQDYGCGGMSNNWCSKRFSIGGVAYALSKRSKSLVAVYDGDNSCGTVPVQLVITNQLTCMPPEVPMCKRVQKGLNTVYQEYDCIDDTVATAALKFDGTPYLIMENYVNGSNCKKQEGTVVYNANGKCHPANDGSSFKILPSWGGSVTIASYSTASCANADAEYTTVGTKYINTDACYQNKFKLYGKIPAMTEPSTQTCSPTSTTSTPTPTPTHMPTADDVDQKTRAQILLPAWLWEPTRPRLFASGGRNDHRRPSKA